MKLFEGKRNGTEVKAGKIWNHYMINLFAGKKRMGEKMCNSRYISADQTSHANGVSAKKNICKLNVNVNT